MPDESITKANSANATWAASDRSISPQEFVFRCVFGRVSSQPKQSVSMRRPDLSSRERPSCIFKANLCCWKKAILGWCRKAHEGAAAVLFARHLVIERYPRTGGRRRYKT